MGEYIFSYDNPPKKPKLKCNILGSIFLKMFLGFRVVSIRGRFGGGKTHLGVSLCYWLLGSGYVDRIVTNVPVFYHLDDGIHNLTRTAIMLDESWSYINSRDDVLTYSAYLRKLDSYLILPSVFDIHRRLDFFNVERIYNLQAFGIPAWYYKWSLSQSKNRDNGSFILVNPQSMYGTYDTRYIPFDDAGINKRLTDTISEIGATINGTRTLSKDGARSSVRGGGVGGFGADVFLDLENGLQSISEEFDISVSEASRRIEKISRRR